MVAGLHGMDRIKSATWKEGLVCSCLPGLLRAGAGSSGHLAMLGFENVWWMCPTSGGASDMITELDGTHKDDIPGSVGGKQIALLYVDYP